MITITRKFEFDAAHRVMNHESKCATLHGHRYVLEVKATAPDLDSLGRVIDFSVLKEKLGTWIDQFWDHTTILNERDRDTVKAFKMTPKFKDCYLLPSNPTAENMAQYFLKKCPELLAGTEVTVVAITLWETPNCKAEVTLGERNPH